MNELGSWKGAYEQFLWALVEDGHSVAAEICRLSDNLPSCFVEPSKSVYSSLLIDFVYFEKSDQYERLFNANKELETLFYEENEVCLRNFELLFQALANFVTGFLEYCEQRGADDSSTWRGVDDLSKELEIEAVCLVMQVCLLLERRLPSKAAELLYVAIYRNSDSRAHIEFLVDFLRVKANSTDTLAKRIKINTSFINDVISVFDRLYHQSHHTSAHWLARLGPNASASLFCCLSFAPHVLNDQQKMRNFVDNFYRDHWVLCLGMGLLINLFDEWANYKAAYNTLLQQIDIGKARNMAEDHLRRLAAIELPQGTIDACKLKKHLHTIQEYNKELRWLVLHSYDVGIGKKGGQFVAAVQMATQFQTRSLRATLRIANVEIEFFKSYRHHLHDKETAVKSLTTEACNMIGEMASVLNQGFSSLKVEKKGKLHDWLLLMKKTLEEADPLDPDGALVAQHVKRRIMQASAMLDLSGNLAMSQYVQKVCAQLDTVTAAYSVNEEELRGAERAAAPAYAWIIADSWAGQVEKLLVESSNTQPVRALFHKLSLAVSVLCSELHSDERKVLIGRAYSSHLESRLRKILQSVPRKLFTLLHTKVIPLLQIDWPPQIDKKQVKELADFDDNFQLAEATFTISNMSIGISRMALTRVGTIDVRPVELLTEGIRRELKTQLVTMIQAKGTTVNDVVSSLSSSLHSLQSAFVYMCEHVDIAAHELWRQEIKNCMETMADKEIGGLVAQKSSSSKKASFTWTLKPCTALGTLLEVILKTTAPTSSHYTEAEMSWRDNRSNLEVFTSNEANAIENWIPSCAIGCLDRLLSTLLHEILTENTQLVRKVVSSSGADVTCTTEFFSSRSFEVLQKTVTGIPNLTPNIVKMGQIVLLRQLLLQAKRENARLRAPGLCSALETANRISLLKLSSLEDMQFLCDLLRETSLVTPYLARFRRSRSSTCAPAKAALVLFTSLLTALPKTNNGRSSVCTSSLLLGLRIQCMHLGCLPDILTVSSVFSDSLVILPSNQKTPPHFQNAAQIVVNGLAG